MRTACPSDLFRADPDSWRDTSIARAGRGRFGVVSALAAGAVETALKATRDLCADVFGAAPQAELDLTLVDLWCATSFRPEGWRLPEQWDAFARDYATSDGWIRLHTNAEHHRAAALTTLGNPATPEETADQCRRWRKAELAQAIVDAGGAAAELNSSEEWRSSAPGQAVACEPIIEWRERESAASLWRPGTKERPLAGLKVLDLTRIIAGPVSTRFLAILGADVLRIDPPGWREGGNELEMSLGKTCATLDLRAAPDRATFERLVSEAHLLVHGYRRDALPRLGYDRDALARLNPAAPSVSLTAYGWTGPWAARRGFDSLVQRSTGLATPAESGVAALPYQVLDHATGYLMAAAAIDALRRQQTRRMVRDARLSLARQAQILLEQNVDAASLATEPAPQMTATEHPETTSWGPGWRLPPPYRLEAVSAGWDAPAHPLGSDAPQWRSA